jgi:alpha-1,6-mannosyltransferase
VIAVRIVRLANCVTPRSGGLRTALHALGEGYLAAGHEAVVVIPGDRAADEQTPAGRLVTVRGTRVPWTGGYRVMLGEKRLAATLERLEPDRIEVSDRFTLRWTGRWAREHGVASLMVSHESLRGLLAVAGLPAPVARYLADRINARTVRRYDTVVCTTAWASEEFDRFAAANIRRSRSGSTSTSSARTGTTRTCAHGCLVPSLIGLSIVEFWHGIRGLTTRFDHRITADVRATIEGIEAPPEHELAM